MALRATKNQVRILQQRLDGEADDVTPAKPRNNEEEREQALLFRRRDELMPQYPALGWMFATLNGVYLPDALKKRVAASGLTKGVLDVWLPVKRTDPDGAVWSGLILDMKIKKGGRPSKDQLDWATFLIRQGFRVYFCAGAVDAWRTIAAYLGITGRDNYAADLERQSEVSDLLSGR